MPVALLRTAELFWTGMLAHLWQTTLLLIVLWLLSRTMRHAPASLLSTLWWIGALKLFLPLAVLGPLTAHLLASLSGLVENGPVPAARVWESVTVVLYPGGLSGSGATDPVPGGPVYVVLSIAWLAGLGAIGFVRLRRAEIRTAERPLPCGSRYDEIDARVRAAIRSTPIPRDAVVLAAGPGLPAVRGLLRCRIELPAHVAESLDVADLRAVLLHENEHRRRRDPLRSALIGLASWLFFFFPPLWWLLPRIHESTEMACDEAVLRFGIAPRQYARSIARTLELEFEPAFAPGGIGGPYRSSLRRRLTRLLAERRYRIMPRHRITLATALAIALVCSFTPFSPAGSDPPDDPPAERSSPKGETKTLAAPDNARPTPAAKVRVAGMDGVSAPRRIEKSYVKPVYPEAMRIAMLEGRVILQALIDATGRVTDVEVLNTNQPDFPELTESAIKALEQWRYEPATLDGEPVAVYFTVVIQYSLNGHKKEKPEASAEKEEKDI